VKVLNSLTTRPDFAQLAPLVRPRLTDDPALDPVRAEVLRVEIAELSKPAPYEYPHQEIARKERLRAKLAEAERLPTQVARALEGVTSRARAALDPKPVKPLPKAAEERRSLGCRIIGWLKRS
jgi:hypothetical protein